MCVCMEIIPLPMALYIGQGVFLLPKWDVSLNRVTPICHPAPINSPLVISAPKQEELIKKQ